MATPDPAAPQSLARRLRELAVLGCGSLLLAAGLVAADEAYYRLHYTPALDRALAAEEGFDRLDGGLRDAQAAVRGRRLTGGGRDSEVARPYADGVEAVVTGAGAVAAAGLRPATAVLLTDVQRAAGRWQREYAGPVVVALDAGAPPPVTDALDAGLFAGYRAPAAALERALAREVADLRAQRRLVREGLLGTALLLLLGGAATGGVRARSTARLLGEPVRVLRRAADAAVAGDPLPTETVRALELQPLQAALVTIAGQQVRLRERVAEQDGRLDRAARSHRLLLEQTRLLSDAADAPRVAATTGDTALALLSGRTAAVWLLDGHGVRHRVYCTAGVDEQAGAPPAELDAGSGLADRTLHFGRVFADRTPQGWVVAAPLTADGRTLGAVGVLLAGDREPGGADLDALQLVAGQGAAALAAARRVADSALLSRRDPLTALPNRRQLEADLDELALAGGELAGLLVLDVDHFKRYNDTHGHAAGDELLRALGEVLLGVVRSEDTAYRYGGEEFVVLLRECTPEGLQTSAERLRETVARRLVAQGVTVSVGAASAHRVPLERLFAEADAALYRAKGAGRDRVAVAGEPAGEPLAV